MLLSDECQSHISFIIVQVIHNINYQSVWVAYLDPACSMMCLCTGVSALHCDKPSDNGLHQIDILPTSNWAYCDSMRFALIYWSTSVNSPYVVQSLLLSSAGCPGRSIRCILAAETQADRDEQSWYNHGSWWLETRPFSAAWPLTLFSWRNLCRGKTGEIPKPGKHILNV